MTLWRLEWLRLLRTRRLLVLVGVYTFFGLLGPLTARYLPQIIERFGGEMTVIVPDPVPADGMAQFGANAQQVGLLVLVVIAAGALTFHALPEMAIFLRTRARSVGRLLVPRAAVTWCAAAIALVVGTAAAWYETAILLGTVPAGAVLAGTALGLVYLAFVVGVVAAVAARSPGLLATAAGSLIALLALPLLGLLSPVAPWLPSYLVGAPDALVAGRTGFTEYLGAMAVSLAATAGLLALAARMAGTREI
ncbi:MAG: hypothetical protein ABIJ48_13285 [Actinomycetota bacterium]